MKKLLALAILAPLVALASIKDIDGNNVTTSTPFGNVDGETGTVGEFLALQPGEPAQYLKDAAVADNTLTITKKDGSTVTFAGGGTGTITDVQTNGVTVVSNGVANIKIRTDAEIEDIATNADAKAYWDGYYQTPGDYAAVSNAAMNALAGTPHAWDAMTNLAVVVTASEGVTYDAVSGSILFDFRDVVATERYEVATISIPHHKISSWIFTKDEGNYIGGVSSLVKVDWDIFDGVITLYAKCPASYAGWARYYNIDIDSLGYDVAEPKTNDTSKVDFVIKDDIGTYELSALRTWAQNVHNGNLGEDWSKYPALTDINTMGKRIIFDERERYRIYVDESTNLVFRAGGMIGMRLGFHGMATVDPLVIKDFMHTNGIATIDYTLDNESFNPSLFSVKELVRQGEWTTVPTNRLLNVRWGHVDVIDPPNDINFRLYKLIYSGNESAVLTVTLAGLVNIEGDFGINGTNIVSWMNSVIDGKVAASQYSTNYLTTAAAIVQASKNEAGTIATNTADEILAAYTPTNNAAVLATAEATAKDLIATNFPTTVVTNLAAAATFAYRYGQAVNVIGADTASVALSPSGWTDGLSAFVIYDLTAATNDLTFTAATLLVEDFVMTGRVQTATWRVGADWFINPISYCGLTDAEEE